MKEAVSRKKDACNAMCQDNTDENKRHRIMKNKAKKVVSKAIREKAEKAHTELKNCQNGMFRLVKGLKIDSKEVEGGRCMRERCMRGSDGKLFQ